MGSPFSPRFFHALVGFPWPGHGKGRSENEPRGFRAMRTFYQRNPLSQYLITVAHFARAERTVATPAKN